MTEDEEDAWTAVEGKRSGKRRSRACAPRAAQGRAPLPVAKTNFAKLDDVAETCLQAQRAGDSEASTSSPREDTEGQDGDWLVLKSMEEASKVEAAKIADAVLPFETFDDLVGSGTHVHRETNHNAPEQPSSLEAMEVAAVAAAAAASAEAAGAEAVPPVLKDEAVVASGPTRSCTWLVGDDSPQAESKIQRRHASRKRSKARKKQ